MMIEHQNQRSRREKRQDQKPDDVDRIILFWLRIFRSDDAGSAARLQDLTLALDVVVNFNHFLI